MKSMQNLQFLCNSQPYTPLVLNNFLIVPHTTRYLMCWQGELGADVLNDVDLPDLSSAQELKPTTSLASLLPSVSAETDNSCLSLNNTDLHNYSVWHFRLGYPLSVSE